MQNRFASHRSRTAAAVLTVLPVIAAAALTGCDAGQDTTTKGAAAAKHRPSAARAPVWDRSPESVAAVGDSITRGSTPVRC